MHHQTKSGYQWKDIKKEPSFERNRFLIDLTPLDLKKVQATLYKCRRSLSFRRAFLMYWSMRWCNLFRVKIRPIHIQNSICSVTFSSYTYGHSNSSILIRQVFEVVRFKKRQILILSEIASAEYSEILDKIPQRSRALQMNTIFLWWANNWV